MSNLGTVRKKSSISLKRLIEVLSLESNAQNDSAVVNYINDFIEQNFKTGELEPLMDGFGNMYIKKGNAKSYPCIVSHVDTVHDIRGDKKVYKKGDILFAFSEKKKGQIGIGGDDLVGVYMCLQALLDFDNIKVVFFKDEEVGCVGSRYSIEAHKSWYEDVSFIIQPDRWGNRDFIYKSGGITTCSTTFLKACDPFLEKFNYKRAVGISTDMDKLVKDDVGISAVNVSCGYYRPHTDLEYVSVKDVNRCYRLIKHIILNLGESKFEYIYVPPKVVTRYSSSYRQTSMFKNLIPVGDCDMFKRHSTILKNEFVYDGNDVLKIDTKCPECAEEELVFMKDTKSFFCCNCRDYLSLEQEQKVACKLQVMDTGNFDMFVYDHEVKIWYKEKNSYWNKYVKKHIYLESEEEYAQDTLTNPYCRLPAHNSDKYTPVRKLETTG